ncbi:MAG TPA: UDP-N-acetylmuramate dehydrogenase [Syntrophomonadaceae bacterium]|nr:UDP-N-acetylmuramate dehydrogenase [Syntrophomonadaceae bacterium]
MYSELTNILYPSEVRLQEPMSRHTTFGIGGPADALVMAGGIEDIRRTLQYCQSQNIPCFVLGMGSNILVRDKGIRGIVIKIGQGLTTVQISDEEIYAEAGVSLYDLAKQAADQGLSGLEFAEGIPGSLGGAVVMNAGAYGGEIKDILVEVKALDQQGNDQKYSPQQMGMGYRKSIFQELDSIVLAARLHLRRGDCEEIKERMKEYSRQRQEKQPLESPSAGSTFRRPEGYYVGPMIEELGLKGFTVGGAQVSPKHAGFVVNRGHATAQDVLDLIQIIQNKARKRFGVELHTEIKVVGEE